MMRLVCLLALVGLAVGDTVNLNQMVDQLLAGLDAQIVQQGKDSIPIEDMNNDWHYRWHFLKLSGHINCHDGYAKSLGSLRRTGDVSMTTAGNTITLRAELGLGNLEVGFQKCQVKAKRLFSVTEHVHGSVRSNSIAAQITLVKNGDQCNAHVDRLEITNLGRIDINTGGSVLHKIQDKLINWFARHLNDKVKGAVNQKLVEAAQQRVNQINLCAQLPV